MSHYGICAKTGGVPCGIFLESPARNGRYQVVFEPEFASLEEIGGIDGAAPAAGVLNSDRYAAGLPEGYGFKVEDISYRHIAKSYTV